MEPASAASNVATAQNGVPIPVAVVRQPSHHLVMGLLLAFIGVVELAILDPTLGFREWFRAGWWIVFGSCFLFSYFTHSITVTRDVMVMRRWFRAEAIRTDDFVSIERNGSWIRRSDTVITKHGSVRAPWYHPNLSAAVRKAINEVDARHMTRLLR